MPQIIPRKKAKKSLNYFHDARPVSVFILKRCFNKLCGLNVQEKAGSTISS